MSARFVSTHLHAGSGRELTVAWDYHANEVGAWYSADVIANGRPVHTFRGHIVSGMPVPPDRVFESIRHVVDQHEID